MEDFERKEKVTDMELALFLIQHIENPCEDLQGHNIRDFYIREAKKILDTFAFQNLDAKSLLEETIQKYEKQSDEGDKNI